MLSFTRQTICSLWSESALPNAPSSMKIYAAKLLILLNPVSIHLFRLIVQLIALHETVTAGFSAEAKHTPKYLEN
jgi:hypothetical protein